MRFALFEIFVRCVRRLCVGINDLIAERIYVSFFSRMVMYAMTVMFGGVGMSKRIVSRCVLDGDRGSRKLLGHRNIVGQPDDVGFRHRDVSSVIGEKVERHGQNCYAEHYGQAVKYDFRNLGQELPHESVSFF